MNNIKSKKSKKPRTTDELYDALTPKEKKVFLRMEHAVTVKKIEPEFRIGWMDDTDFYVEMSDRGGAPKVNIYPTKKACERDNSCTNPNVKWSCTAIRVKVTRA